MTETKQSKIPSFAAMRRRSSKPTRESKPSIEKPSPLPGVCASGGAGVGQAEGRSVQVNKPAISSRPSPTTQPPPQPEKKITDYVLGPLQMHCLREFAAGRCDRLEITPAYKVPFIEGVSIGRSSENRARPAVMRCERRIYSRKTGAFAYVELKLIQGDLRASRCSAAVEREHGLRYDDGDGQEF